MSATKVQPTITAAMVARGRILAEPRLSPDRVSVAFVSVVDGRASIVVVPVAVGPEVVITGDPAPPPTGGYDGGVFDWAPDCRSIVHVGVDGGLHVAPIDGGPSRPVTGTQSSMGPAGAPAVSPDGEWVAYTVDAHHVAVASLDADGPWPIRLSTGADFCFDPTWSPDSTFVAWHEWDAPNMPWDSSRIVMASIADNGRVLVAGGPDIAVQQPRFSPDGSSIAFLCDRDGWMNLWAAGAAGEGARSLLKEEAEHGDPAWAQGRRSFAWSPDNSHIAFCRNESGYGRLAVVDLGTDAVFDVAMGVHGGLSWVGDKLVAIRSGARTPTELVAYRMSAEQPRPTVLARGPLAGFEVAALREPEIVDWPQPPIAENVTDEPPVAAPTSRARRANFLEMIQTQAPAPDAPVAAHGRRRATKAAGPLVHGRLYRPIHSATGSDPPPMIVSIHGGPTGQTPVALNGRIAYWVDRGWAVLVPDYRGSTGWGRAYAQALHGGWGLVDTEDVAAGMRAAAEQGWCDSKRMVPMGGSAGGFTVLNLLAHHPDLCAAGVDLYGVTDLFDLAETTHRFEAHYLETIVGPLPAAVDKYRQHSPVTVAEQITAPLLILQGTEDKAVPPAQSRRIAERLERLGRPVELHLYEGEGHGWGRPDTIIDELTRVEDFLRRHVLTGIAG